MGFDSTDVVFLYIVAAMLAIVLWTLYVYVTEVRRVGSHPWSEWYNDHVVTLLSRRRSGRR